MAGLENRPRRGRPQFRGQGRSRARPCIKESGKASPLGRTITRFLKMRRPAFRHAGGCMRASLPLPARCGVDFEYERCGALAYMAAWDVHRAKVFGLYRRKTGIAAFHDLVDLYQNGDWDAYWQHHMQCEFERRFRHKAA